MTAMEISNIISGVGLSFKANPTYIKAIAIKIPAAISFVVKYLLRITVKNIKITAVTSPEITSIIVFFFEFFNFCSQTALVPIAMQRSNNQRPDI
jgi:hypothetical protein